MRKLKDAHIFSNEEGSIAKFFEYMSFFVVAQSNFISDFIFDKVLKWREYVLECLIYAAFLTIIYFISRWLAYRTRIFPKAKYREAIHGMSFFLLWVLGFVLLFVFI